MRGTRRRCLSQLIKGALVVAVVFMGRSMQIMLWDAHSGHTLVASSKPGLRTDLANASLDTEGHDSDLQYVQKLLAKSVAIGCPQTRRPARARTAHTHWQVHGNVSHEIFVYSAFYDDRPATGVLPSIRIQAVTADGYSDNNLWCHLWYDGYSSPEVTPVMVTQTGRGHTTRGGAHYGHYVHYGQYMYTCVPPHGAWPVPSHVSVSAGTDRCATSTILLPVYQPVRAPWQHEFGVCVAVAFGEMPLETFVEWAELHALLGVTEINVYNATMTPKMAAVLNHYKRTGLLRVRPMPPPKPDYTVQGAKMGSPASLNDCMLRNMYRYRYIVVVDFDEVILPAQDTSYHALLDRIDRDEKLSEPWLSYTFRNVYHFLDLPPPTAADNKAPPAGAVMLRYTARSKQESPYLFAPKSFIDPRRCVSVFNHYCYIRYKNSLTPQKWTVDVNVTVAMSHHYRKCNFGQKKCAEIFNSTVVDHTLDRFSEQLTKNMERSIAAIKGGV